MRKLGFERDERFNKRYDWTEIRTYYDAGNSMRQCQQKFGFSGGAWTDAVNRGDIEPRPRAEPIEDLFVIGPKRNRYHLKRRLLDEGLKDPWCAMCGISEWRGAPLPLELHHINGNPRDNRLVNLELLCPNCHSQTDNWGGKAKLLRVA
jgi:hypothetical protein